MLSSLILSYVVGLSSLKKPSLIPDMLLNIKSNFSDLIMSEKKILQLLRVELIKLEVTNAHTYSLCVANLIYGSSERLSKG